MCLESVAHLLVMLNFSTNFLIYCSVSAPFKKALSKVKDKGCARLAVKSMLRCAWYSVESRLQKMMRVEEGWPQAEPLKTLPSTLRLPISPYLEKLCQEFYKVSNVINIYLHVIYMFLAAKNICNHWWEFQQKHVLDFANDLGLSKILLFLKKCNLLG